ncbi:unnamed protein product [Rhizoctonia solani]|uniref:DNA 3'-5' helicase n=1 Tax=Rhizoctonia solani TaxID=456999 RepID=A0A8H3CLM8_9AGAM|nr:unnamed protein product [Rhizoctonia solani]
MKRRLEIGLMRRYSTSMNIPRQMAIKNHLEGLNGPQRQAVMFPPNSPLQILAGPGTGKTRVLTSRLANLVLNHSYLPSSICAVTFTRKASKEMKARLYQYLDSNATEDIKLGTFHSVCLNYLRSYGTMVHVEPGFLVWDEDECILVLRHLSEKAGKDLTKDFLAKELYEMFSNVKEKVKITPGAAIDSMIKEELKRKREDHNSSAHDSPQIQLQSKLLLELYYSYSHTLRASNALDFTDLLSKGLDLLQAVPWAREVGRLKHVLVDEFQDTSSLQYLIVKELFKATRGSISVVGDPDQSIYKWRGADDTVFRQMKKDLPKTKEIYLEENYRSTASIITTAIDIISQDETRPPKALFTSYTPHGPKPVKKSLDIKHEEEAYIVEEINRIVTNSAETIDYGDCAILFRDNRSADQFSQVLFKAGIPYRQLPEPSLMEQFEVISLIAFLRLAINDAHTPMVIRALKGPLALDEKAITDLMTRSAGHRITLFDALQRVRGGYDRDTNPSCISASNLLIRILRHLRDFMHQGASPADLLHYIIEATNYHEFLMQNFTKNYSRRARNVQRTIQYAKLFKGKKELGPMPVRLFLDFMRELSRVDDFNTGKVTLLTCHSAKGLEWPVVFVPSVVDGVYPHHKSQSISIDEERRLLYVACTRAQCLLYLTRSETKLINQRGIPVEVQQYESEFTEHLLPETYQNEAPTMDTKALDLFRKILGRN